MKNMKNYIKDWVQATGKIILFSSWLLPVLTWLMSTLAITERSLQTLLRAHEASVGTAGSDLPSPAVASCSDGQGQAQRRPCEAGPVAHRMRSPAWRRCKRISFRMFHKLRKLVLIMSGRISIPEFMKNYAKSITFYLRVKYKLLYTHTNLILIYF